MNLINPYSRYLSASRSADKKLIIQSPFRSEDQQILGRSQEEFDQGNKIIISKTNGTKPLI